MIEIDGKSYPNVSKALSDRRIVHVRRMPDGSFEILEMCDEYFRLTLTREQFLLWVAELQALATI